MSRTRKGHKKSRPSHNAKHQTEAEIRLQTEEERRIKRRAKKRRRKDLSADEIDVIVEATKQPYKRQKDIAFEH